MHSGRVCFDSDMPFAKATGMNRYRLAGSQGAIMISLPIQGGRSHPQPLGQVRLATEQGRSGEDGPKPIGVASKMLTAEPLSLNTWKMT